MELFRQLMTALTNLKVGVSDVWKRLTPGAKANIAVAGLASVFAITMLVFWGSGTEYVELYKLIDLKDSSPIRTYLTEQNVAYRLADGNRTILVPVNRVSDVRMMLSDNNLTPKFQGGVTGFEIFEKQDLLSNRWLQDMNYMRAVQGELQRQLNDFEFVNSSRVFISESKEELFVDKQKPSKAAVTLDVTRPPSKREIKAILGVISSFGGPNLTPSNITLTTQDAVPLHLPPTDKFASIANSKLEYKTEVEQQRIEKIRKMFEIMGKKAIVSVSADVSWESVHKKESTSVTGAELSTWSVASNTTTSEGPPEGPAGATSNPPGGMGASGTSSTVTEEEQTINNYQPSTTLTDTVTEPGNITKFSATVMVETDYQEVDGADGVKTLEAVALTEDKITEFRTLIASALGGGTLPESVAVYGHPFRTAAVGVLSAGMLPSAQPWWTKKGIMTTGEILLLMIFFLLFRRWLKKLILVPVEAEEEFEKVAEIPLASPEDLRRQEVAAEVERLAVEEPEAVAALLRSWMAEEEQ